MVSIKNNSMLKIICPNLQSDERDQTKKGMKSGYHVPVKEQVRLWAGVRHF
jgi:hypothetical protein